MIVTLLEVAACIKKLFADSAYAGPKLQDALTELGVSELIEHDGHARSESLTGAQRKEIATKAANARWNSKAPSQ